MTLRRIWKTIFANKCPYVFDNGLGKLPGKVHLQVELAFQLVILPARKVPVSVKGKFKAKLKRLQDLNVIAPVDQPTEWISQFVVALEKSLVIYGSALILNR